MQQKSPKATTAILDDEMGVDPDAAPDAVPVAAPGVREALFIIALTFTNGQVHCRNHAGRIAGARTAGATEKNQ